MLAPGDTLLLLYAEVSVLKCTCVLSANAASAINLVAPISDFALLRLSFLIFESGPLGAPVFRAAFFSPGTPLAR